MSRPVPTGGLVQRVRSRLALRTRLRRWRRRRDPARRNLPRLLVNGFPKSGTHLLRRAIDLFPGMASDDLWIPPQEFDSQKKREEILKATERLLDAVAAGEYVMGHVWYDEEIATLLEERGFRSVLILRDPRDVAVSLAAHITTWPDHRLHEYFHRELANDAERLRAVIEGTTNKQGKTLPNLGERLDRFLPWQKMDFNFTTRFERLVGPQGGGSAEAQQTEIERIAYHLGFSLTSQQTESIARQLFWEQSLTFRQGQVGSWRESFSEEHKEACKRVAGRELIELGYEGDLNW